MSMESSSGQDFFMQYTPLDNTLENSEFYSSSLPFFLDNDVQKKAFAIIYRGNKGWPYANVIRQQRPALTI